MRIRIIVLMALLCVVYASVFFIPDRVEQFSLAPDKVEQGEWWRFFTYPFTHLNTTHLVENIIGALLIGLIAAELKIEFTYMLIIYLLAGFLAVLPLWFVWQFVALGASAAIFGGFGLISKETPKYEMNSAIVILLILAFTFASSIFRFFTGGINEQFLGSLKQDASHFSGFLFGVASYSIALRANNALTAHKRHLLRGMTK